MPNEAGDRSFLAGAARAWRQWLGTRGVPRAADNPAPPQERGPASGDEHAADPELARLRQELARCQEEREKLDALYDEVASRYAALNFKAYKLSEDNFTFETNATGLRAQNSFFLRERDQLRMEIGILRQVIASCDSQTDQCRQFREEILRQAQAEAEGTEGKPRDGAAGPIDSDSARPAAGAARRGEP
jgi:hypothetical protein